ncbi:FAD-binding domain-containing protein [Aspergillus brunneoviolaceus CBS 621.78]|uniref:FAD-binding domain-containing protein n=1 Tax=Aspergillus brunneoviolaceus CBS 621.78 TaxID=1450534 RepID=A0ACD1GBP6_9EURO|nr:FAD-binding domain-containing protein [Aspergillus brunneoviolaceus CBS 621.78]RAH46637.1 FAD-binding domain-containing protein [Aspergillus brunneoviolaceus CBS 621.78]
MGALLPSVAIATALVVLVFRFLGRLSSPPELKPAPQDGIPPVPHLLGERLVKALPQGSVLLLHRDGELFRQSLSTYFARQERDVVQAVIVQPRTTQEVSTAIQILKQEHQRRQSSGALSDNTLFAVRGGGQSPLTGAASAKGGVLIDLTHFREVTVAEDRESVVIGAGSRWGDVSRTLDELNLGVVGGRSADVGVGGFTLGGGISFFTPRYGLACSNVIAYEVVLASGATVTATASSHPELWRALKGGSNNFGIVTRFTVRCFSSSPIWSGYIYAPGSQCTKALLALHNSVKRMDPKSSGAEVDSYAAGAIVCDVYLQPISMRLLALQLAYTKTPESPEQWPAFWQRSGFSALWRYWSTHKVQSVTSAVEEVNRGCWPSKRSSFGTTTIKNDLATIMAAHDVFREATASLRKVEGSMWTMVMQPLLPSWTAKGDPNVIGVHESTNEPLIIINMSIDWDGAHNDEYVYSVVRGILAKINAIAEANGRTHPYRYLNYCENWQRPLVGYGEQKLEFLRKIGQQYDPDGLFQTGCTGGFKLSASAD